MARSRHYSMDYILGRPTWTGWNFRYYIYGLPCSWRLNKLKQDCMRVRQASYVGVIWRAIISSYTGYLYTIFKCKLSVWEKWFTLLKIWDFCIKIIHLLWFLCHTQSHGFAMNIIKTSSNSQYIFNRFSGKILKNGQNNQVSINISWRTKYQPILLFFI